MKTKRFFALALASVMAFSFATTAFARYKGDITNDGLVNSSDALIVLRYAVGAEKSIDKTVADMNGDGKINSSDALAILQTSVGMTDKEELPENEDVPETAEEILALYNNAVNKAVDEKAGYTKERTTTVTNLDAGSYTSLAGGIVKDFLGEGTNKVTNSKGTAKHLTKSTLTVADLTKVKYELSGSTYTVTLFLKDGASSATSSSKTDNSAIAKSGLVSGNSVSTTIDYINSGSIYTSIIAEGVGVNKISATNTNATIVIVVDKSTGNLISYTAAFDWAATIENISVKFPPVKLAKATGNAHTAVELSGFKW